MISLKLMQVIATMCMGSLEVSHSNQFICADVLAECVEKMGNKTGSDYVTARNLHYCAKSYRQQLDKAVDKKKKAKKPVVFDAKENI